MGVGRRVLTKNLPGKNNSEKKVGSKRQKATNDTDPARPKTAVCCCNHGDDLFSKGEGQTDIKTVSLRECQFLKLLIYCR